MVGEETAVRRRHAALRPTCRSTRTVASEDGVVRGGREDFVHVMRAPRRGWLMLCVVIVGGVRGGGVELDL